MLNKGKSWASTMNNICISMGDCGVKTNAIGAFGYPKEDVKVVAG